jgi:hypothetical protein
MRPSRRARINPQRETMLVKHTYGIRFSLYLWSCISPRTVGDFTIVGTAPKHLVVRPPNLSVT